jgi:hypothetical protein
MVRMNFKRRLEIYDGDMELAPGFSLQLLQTEEQRSRPAGTSDCAGDFRERLVMRAAVDHVLVEHRDGQPRGFGITVFSIPLSTVSTYPK